MSTNEKEVSLTEDEIKGFLIFQCRLILKCQIDHANYDEDNQWNQERCPNGEGWMDNEFGMYILVKKIKGIDKEYLDCDKYSADQQVERLKKLSIDVLNGFLEYLLSNVDDI